MPTRAQLQFSLRTLMLLMAAVALLSLMLRWLMEIVLPNVAPGVLVASGYVLPAFGLVAILFAVAWCVSLEVLDWCLGYRGQRPFRGRFWRELVSLSCLLLLTALLFGCVLLGMLQLLLMLLEKVFFG